MMFVRFARTGLTLKHYSERLGLQVNLSLSMIAKRLSDFEVVASISDDAQTISSMRALPESQVDLSPTTVYFGNELNYKPARDERHHFIVVHNKDFLRVYTNSYTSLLNSMLSSFDYYNSWESELLELASRHAPLQEMINASDMVLDNPAFVMDFEGNILAITPEHDDRPETEFYREFRRTGKADPKSTSLSMTDERGEAVLYSSSAIPLVMPDNDQQLPHLPATVMRNDEPVAILIVSQSNIGHVNMDRLLIRELLRFLGQAAEFQDSTLRSQLRSTILHDLIDGVEIDDSARSRISSSSISSPYVLAAFHSGIDYDVGSLKLNTGQLMHAINNSRIPTICTTYGNDAFALVGSAQLTQLIDELQLTFGLKNWQVGVSLPFSNVTTMPLRRRQASFALVQGDNKPGLFKCEDFALEYLLSRIRVSDDGLELRHPAIILLKHYDEEHQADLGETLFQYLRLNHNLASTAEALHVHRNSLGYRLKRIKEICDTDLEDPEENHYILMSFYLDRLDSGQQRHVVDRTYSSRHTKSRE